MVERIEIWKFDQDKLAHDLKTGENRVQFITDMELEAAFLQQTIATECRNAPMLDVAWETWLQAVRRTARKHFEMTKPVYNKELNKDVKRLLSESHMMKFALGSEESEVEVIKEKLKEMRKKLRHQLFDAKRNDFFQA